MSSNNQRTEGIFKRYGAQLRGYISKQISSRSDAEDILQSVFYRFITTESEKESIEHVCAWLYRVAGNLIIDHRRKHREQRMPTLFADEDREVPLLELLASDDQSPEGEFVRSMIWDEIQAALEELPQEQRTVFELNELEGISFKEISQATGVPINTLISRKRYATLHLRERLSSLYEEVTQK